VPRHDALTWIKRLVVAGNVEFTEKALEEQVVDDLAVEDVLESVLNANAIKKVLRSKSPFRTKPHERLYVIESPSFAGIWIYTKGAIRRQNRGKSVFYVFVSSKISQ
jgi:hypothetical protein